MWTGDDSSCECSGGLDVLPPQHDVYYCMRMMGFPLQEEKISNTHTHTHTQKHCAASSVQLWVTHLTQKECRWEGATSGMCCRPFLAESYVHCVLLPSQNGTLNLTLINSWLSTEPLKFFESYCKLLYKGSEGCHCLQREKQSNSAALCLSHTEWQRLTA